MKMPVWHRWGDPWSSLECQPVKWMSSKFGGLPVRKNKVKRNWVTPLHPPHGHVHIHIHTYVYHTHKYSPLWLMCLHSAMQQHIRNHCSYLNSKSVIRFSQFSCSPIPPVPGDHYYTLNFCKFSFLIFQISLQSGGIVFLFLYYFTEQYHSFPSFYDMGLILFLWELFFYVRVLLWTKINNKYYFTYWNSSLENMSSPN